jgi:thymidylate kinase
MTEEVWKDINGYEGLYQVSNMGKVRSLDRITKNGQNSTYLLKGKNKKLILKDNGYLTVSLYKDGKEKNKKVHRLVADAFIPAVDGKNIVNHINGDKTDNVATNLEWSTHTDNLQHAWDIGLRNLTDKQKKHAQKIGAKFKWSKSIPVFQIDTSTNVVQRFWFSKGKASQACNISIREITRSIKNEIKNIQSVRWEIAKLDNNGFFIIIEGCDCSGKSTLINLLSDKYNLPVIKGSDFNIAKQGVDKMFDYMNSIFDKQEVIILDRSFISNLVYAPLFDANMLTETHVKQLIEKIKAKSLTIHLQGDENTILDRLEKRGDDYIKSDNIQDIIAGYNSVTSKLEQYIDITHFDITTYSSKDVFSIISTMLDRMGIRDIQ